MVGGLGCVGKKTTLLQAEASACVSGLANVLFCALAIFIFLFCLLSSKLSAVSLSFYTCAQRVDIRILSSILLISDCGLSAVIQFVKSLS